MTEALGEMEEGTEERRKGGRDRGGMERERERARAERCVCLIVCEKECARWGSLLTFPNRNKNSGSGVFSVAQCAYPYKLFTRHTKVYLYMRRHFRVPTHTFAQWSCVDGCTQTEEIDMTYRIRRARLHRT